ncbi:aminotransferase class I/II-fold pyridoxal phosphate-dependent enzyme, partial [Clostridium saudiense]|nr:aminotransferase class I/II-fold pyridoxal phosphate-dependent enzyme [Clostridium saudiense]
FNSNSIKWDVKENELPMWIADMDFETAPEIIEAIHNKVNLGIFGYTFIPEEYYNSISNWWKNRHNFNIEKEWILFCTGVVPAISSIVRKMTNEGDNVLLQAPVYNMFYNS